MSICVTTVVSIIPRQLLFVSHNYPSFTAGVRQLDYQDWLYHHSPPYVTQLDRLKRWVEAGDLQIEVNHTYNFDHVKDAYAQFEHGGINSRIAIVP